MILLLSWVCRKKTLYQYYADKDELVNEVFNSVLDANRAQCRECTQKGENAIHEVFLSFDMVEEMLTNMNPALLFDMQKYHPTAFKKFQEFRNSFLFRLIKTNLERGIGEELYRPEIDIDLLSRYRVYSVLLSFDPEVFPNAKNQLVYVEQQLMEHFLFGIASAKGQKLIMKYKNQRSKKLV